jgi:hypothetical protein
MAAESFRNAHGSKRMSSRLRQIPPAGEIDRACLA